MKNEQKIESLLITIYEVVESDLCVASVDGQKVYDKILVALKTNQHVKLSFFNVKLLTAAFLNSAIGQLYGNFNESEIREKLSVTNISPEDICLLKRVEDTAKEYFKDPYRFEEISHEVWGIPHE